MKTIVVLIVFSILFVGIYPTNSYIYSDKKEEKPLPSPTTGAEPTTTFYREIGGKDTTWCCVELHANHTIHIRELYVKIAANETGAKWLSVSRLALINFETGEYWTPLVDVGGVHGGYLDWYLQVDIAGLNFTYSHLNTSEGSRTISIDSVHNITLSSGTWYLIVLSVPAPECTITTYINGTNAAIGGVTSGSTAFLLENEDFWATLNLKSAPLSILYDGSTTVSINNTFVGFVYINLWYGRGSIEYMSPEGDTGKCEVWSTFFRGSGLSNDSTFYPASTPILGSYGQWTFNASMVAIGVGNTVGILGADVKLP